MQTKGALSHSGAPFVVFGRPLRHGLTLRAVARTRRMNLTGQTFGRLTAIVPGRRGWICECRCGDFVAVEQYNLRSGHTRSCGCLRRDSMGDLFRTHGQTMGKRPSRAYKSWSGIIQRVDNPKNTDYPRYGGRGITVCERWRIFENFLADMGDPIDGMTIDRIDPDGDYEPDNCRWADRKTQVRNRACVKLTAEKAEQIRRRKASGESAPSLAHEFGISRSMVYQLVNRTTWA